MAVGDVYWGLESVSNDGYLTIQPPSGAEAVITYIFAHNGGKVKVSVYDGTDEAVFQDLSVAGGEGMVLAGHGIPVTNSFYIRVQNKSGGSLVIGFAGTYTKAAS